MEVTNRSLLKMINTRLEGDKGTVARRAPKCPMGLQDYSKNPHRRNSFRLMFGTEVIIPVEIGLTSFKTNEYDEGSNDNHLRLNLDLLDEACDQAEAKTRAYQQRKAQLLVSCLRGE